MKKSKLVLGLLSMFICILAFMARPDSAKAASQSAFRAMFDASYYYETYPDVAAVCGTSESALFSHFIKYGIREGRSGSPEFSVSAYRERYEDLAEAFGDDLPAYYAHYLSCGRKEGRIATESGEAYAAVSRKQTQTSAVITAAAAEPVSESAQAPPNTQSQRISGIYSTYYNESEARAINIAVAASRINGAVIQPGSTFSFSQTVLARTAENGYVVAPVIVSGKMSQGTGGGICQVSSTLYAAMVEAGIPATERHAHSLSMSYIPKGLDATIAGDTKDLKFENIYTEPLVIYASAKNGKLSIMIETLK